MIKRILFTSILFISSFTFSQIKIDENIVGRIYFADDGTFFSCGMMGSTGSWKFKSFEADGTLKNEVSIRGFTDNNFDSKNKRWFNGYSEKGKIGVKQMDEKGNIVTTEYINDKIGKKNYVKFYMDVDKKIEIHVIPYAKIKTGHNGKKLPEIIVQYNSDDKSFKAVDYRVAEDERVGITYIGNIGSTRYFVHSVQDYTKLFSTNKLLIYSDSKIVTKDLPQLEFYYPGRKMLAPEVLLKDYPIVNVKPMKKENGKLYFTINSFHKDEKMVMHLYEITDDDNFRKIEYTLPNRSFVDFPIFFDEQGEEIVFTIRDSWNNRLVIRADFEGEDTDGGTFYESKFSEMKAISDEKNSSYNVFRVCNGYARLIVKGNTKGTLYLKEAAIEDEH